VEVDHYVGREDDSMTAGAIRDSLESLVDRGKVMEFNVDDHDTCIGIRSPGPEPMVLDGAFSALRPRRTYPCWSCEEPLTRRDARTGIVGVPVRTSKFGCRRVGVHAGCEDDVMNEGIGIF
jgi:hypothetical protein